MHPTTPQATVANSHYEIREVASLADLQAVARLRYEVYVVEMGRPQPHADHETRTIHEPLDANSMVFGAFHPDGRAAGTLRITPAPLASPDYLDLYGWSAIDTSERSRCCMATKLIVERQHRGSPVSLRLFKAATADGLRRGLRYCWLDTNAHLVAFYQALGFLLRETKQHALFGPVAIMVWDMHDLAYMRKVRSPLAGVVARNLMNGRDAA